MLPSIEEQEQNTEIEEETLEVEVATRHEEEKDIDLNEPQNLSEAGSNIESSPAENKEPE